jgi:hypothetical protein
MRCADTDVAALCFWMVSVGLCAPMVWRQEAGRAGREGGRQGKWEAAFLRGQPGVRDVQM